MGLGKGRVHLRLVTNRPFVAMVVGGRIVQGGAFGRIPHILKTAEEQRADFIVMGSHGHTAFYDFLVGSTTHGVLKSAPCPVVVLPRRKHTA